MDEATPSAEEAAPSAPPHPPQIAGAPPRPVVAPHRGDAVEPPRPTTVARHTLKGAP